MKFLLPGGPGATYLGWDMFLYKQLTLLLPVYVRC